MEKTNKNIVLRILIAICFVWLPINGALSFLSAKTYLSGDPLAITLGLLPVVAGLFIVFSALFNARAGIGIGCMIYVLQAGYSIYVSIMNMQQGLPDEGKKSFRGLILATALILLAFLFLALACFIKRSDLALCILAVIFFIVWFFVRRGQIPAEASKWPLQLVLTAAGSVLGTILSAMLFAVRKKKVEA